MLILHPHPTTPCPAVDALQASVTRMADGSLHLQYTLSGALAALRIPAPSPSSLRAVDGLWEHTCFEAFIGVQGEGAYHEFNFSPSGQWAAYAFSRYRERETWEGERGRGRTQGCAPTVGGLDGRVLRLDVCIAAADLPANPAGKPLQLGLTAVIEAADGSKSYWALAHPAERPDFHHRDGFVHEIWS